MTESELAAIVGTRRPYKEMADGTLRVQVDIDPEHKDAFLRLFPETGTAVVMARLTAQAEQAHQHDRAAAETSKGGEAARLVRASGMFRAPALWEELGTDDEFRRWLHGQECAAAGRRLTMCRNNEIVSCSGDIVAAHVRRVYKGSGTGIKPEFSAVPLCDAHHKIQHDNGESALEGGRGFFDRKAGQYVEQWAVQAFKQQFGMESMREIVDRTDWIDWMVNAGLVAIIPIKVRELCRT